MEDTMIFFKNTLKKLFLYILILIILNILLCSIIVFKSNNSNKILNILDTISNEITLNNNIYEISHKAINIMEEKQLWAIIIDKNNGNVLFEYKKPKEVSNKFNINDVALFSKFYLNDYPVFISIRNEGLLLLAFPKDSFVRYKTNYFPYKIIKNAPTIFILYILLNLFIIFFLLLSTHLKIIKEIKPVNDAILSIPNDFYYIPKSNNYFKQIYNSINKINMLLNKNEKEKKLWIESISHDIRTPLSTIIGFSSNLSNNNNLDYQTKEKIKQIEKHGKYISELINNLNLNLNLNYDYKLNLQKINFIPFIKNIVINIINENENSVYDISFITDKNIKNIYLNIDTLLFERLIRNIIYNSIKHNPNGCNITVYIEQLNSKLHIKFKDDGIGNDNINNIIENINNKNSNLSLNKLGLFIVSRIIKLHNGKINIYSEKNKFFTVEIIIDILN